MGRARGEGGFSSASFLREATLPAVLFAAATWARLRLRTAPPYGDEGLHFHIAKHFTDLPANFHDVYGNNWWHADYLVFQRPGFYVLFHGPALLSFDAFRAAHILLASALPVLAYFLLRAHGRTRVAAALAGLAIALHPFFVTWGTLVLMDSLMACWFLAALWARQRRRWVLSGALFLLAIWTKETAAFGVAALLACSWVRRYVDGQAPLWPLQLDRPQSALLVAVAAGLLPIVVAMSRGLGTPGGLAHGSPGSIAELLSLSAWLLPPVLAGLAIPASRALSAWALFFSAFFLGLHGAGRAVEAWYAVLPAALCVVAAAAALDAAWQASAPRRRWVPSAVAVGLMAMVAVAAAAPASAGKERAMHPLSGDPAPSLEEARLYETALRDQDFVRAARYVAGQGPERLFLFDVRYGLAYYPFVDQYDDVLGASSGVFHLWPQPLEPVAEAIEANGTLLLVEEQGTALNVAVRDAYAACEVFADGRYRAYEGWRCPGGAGRLRAAVEYPTA